ncbi:MAG: putative acyl-CoA thioesterase [Polaromonas sp.]|nr:putative acyl-CoA thioesterase [Polaromonas sp.]
MNESTGFNQGNDLLALLRLLPDGDQAWVSDRLDGNQNGRVFGGQLLAHAVSAAVAGTTGRHLSSLRLGFLQGALGNLPIRWQATTLQEGSRFTTRHLRATQGSRIIADAQVTLQVPGQGFEHADPMPAGLPPPQAVPTIPELEARIVDSTGERYDLQFRPFLDVRLIEASRFLLQPAGEATLRYWVKTRDPLPDDPAVQAAALAYISDFWFNYAAVASHIGLKGARERIYVASLNHSLWSYAPCRADEWLLFDAVSPCAADGRGLVWGRVYNQAGRLVACASQEMLCTVRTDV